MKVSAGVHDQRIHRLLQLTEGLHQTRLLGWGQVGHTRYAGARGHHGNAAGAGKKNFLQGFLAGQHMADIPLGAQAQRDIDIGQAQVGVK